MKTFISIVLTLLLTVTAPLTVLLYRVDTYVLQPQPLLDVAEQQNTFATLVPTLAETYITDSSLQDMGFTVLPREQLQTVLTNMFNPEWTQATATQLITQAYRLRTPGTTLADLQLTFDMSGPKQRFLTDLSGMNLPTEDGFNPILLATIIPQQLNLAHFMIARETVQTAEDPSDPLGIKDAGEPVSPDERARLVEATPEQLILAQDILAKTHAALPGAALLCLLFFAGIVLLNVGEHRHVFRWVAIAAFFPGVVFLAFGLADDMLIAPRIDAALVALPSTMHTLVRGVASTYLSRLFDLFTIVGVAMMGMTIASTVIGVIEMHHHSRTRKA